VLATASAALRQGAIDLSVLLQRVTPIDLKNKSLKSRLNRLAAGMVSQRESLIRRAVLVERALNAIVPATRTGTYAQAAGPYGSAGKQTGAFKYLAA
jgi:predicted transcriptional regulator